MGAQSRRRDVRDFPPDVPARVADEESCRGDLEISRCSRLKVVAPALRDCGGFELELGSAPAQAANDANEPSRLVKEWLVVSELEDASVFRCRWRARQEHKVLG